METRQDVYLKLHSIPKSAILQQLRKNLGDEQLLSIFASRTPQVTSLSEISRAKVSHDDLISIAIQHEGLSPQEVAELNEEYRYRGMKTLYISTYPRDDQARIDAALEQGASELTTALESIQFDDEESCRSLKIRDIDSFTVNDEQLWEIVYSYVAAIELTDPETEYPARSEDLRFGFIWVNRSVPWIAVSAKDDLISRKLTQVLEESWDTQISRIVIPPQVISDVEPWTRIRRSSHEDSRGIRRRVTGSKLGDYADEVSQLKNRDSNERRTSSSYNVQLPDSTQFVLGYNGEKGILYFSKRLRTSQMREYVTLKVSEIYSELQEMWTVSPGTIVPLVVDGIVKGTHEAKSYISRLLTKVAEIRSQPDQRSALLDIDVLQLAEISRYFVSEISVNCSQCADVESVKCTQCGATHFDISDSSIVCRKCRTKVQTSVLCLQDHNSPVDTLAEIVSLYPKDALYDVVERVFRKGNQPPFNRDEESFFVHGSSLLVSGSVGRKTVYLFRDILEFAAIEDSLASMEILPQYDILDEYREKCEEMQQENCARCVDTPFGRHCFLRLFGLYDSRYTPRPHQGHEFGDVLLYVTLDGYPDRVMLVLLKKGNPEGRTITTHSSVGSQLNSQFEDFLDNPTVDIVAVSVPQKLDDELRVRLKHKAEVAGKKIVFLGADELAKLIAFVSHKNEIPIQDL